MIRKEIRKFAEKEILPLAIELDEQESVFPGTDKKNG
jgi:hypothetical protein